jgi:hypothetical protein
VGVLDGTATDADEVVRLITGANLSSDDFA